MSMTPPCGSSCIRCCLFPLTNHLNPPQVLSANGVFVIHADPFLLFIVCQLEPVTVPLHARQQRTLNVDGMPKTPPEA